MLGERAEVGGLHRPGPSAGGDDEARAGEGVTEGRGVRVGLVVAAQGVATHDTDDREVVEQVGEGVAHRVVVDGPQEGDEHVVPRLASRDQA